MLTQSLHDGLLEMLINGVSAMFEVYCRRVFQQASFTEYHNGRGKVVLFVGNPPIASSPAVEIWDDLERVWGSGTLIDPSQYTIDESEMFIQMDGRTLKDGYKNVKITYTGGYLTIPGDLELACIEQVALKFREATEKNLGVTARGFADGSVSFNWREILPQIKMILDGYRIETWD